MTKSATIAAITEQQILAILSLHNFEKHMPHMQGTPLHRALQTAVAANEDRLRIAIHGEPQQHSRFMQKIINFFQ